MQLAIAEKGLVVFDAVVKGTAGHAAHPNNDNPIIKTMDVIQWFQNLSFDKCRIPWDLLNSPSPKSTLAVSTMSYQHR